MGVLLILVAIFIATRSINKHIDREVTNACDRVSIYLAQNEETK